MPFTCILQPILAFIMLRRVTLLQQMLLSDFQTRRQIGSVCQSFPLTEECMAMENKSLQFSSSPFIQIKAFERMQKTFLLNSLSDLWCKSFCNTRCLTHSKDRGSPDRSLNGFSWQSMKWPYHLLAPGRHTGHNYTGSCICGILNG